MREFTDQQKNQLLNAAITLIEELPVIDDDTMYNLIVGDDTFAEQCVKRANIEVPAESEITEEDAEFIGMQTWDVIDDAYNVVSEVHNVYHPPLFS